MSQFKKGKRPPPLSNPRTTLGGGEEKRLLFLPRGEKEGEGHFLTAGSDHSHTRREEGGRDRFSLQHASKRGGRKGVSSIMTPSKYMSRTTRALGEGKERKKDLSSPFRRGKSVNGQAAAHRETGHGLHTMDGEGKGEKEILRHLFLIGEKKERD